MEQWQSYVESTLDNHATNRASLQAHSQQYERDSTDRREPDEDARLRRVGEAARVERALATLSPFMRDVIEAGFFPSRGLRAEVESSVGGAGAFESLSKRLGARMLVAGLTIAATAGAAKDGGRPLQWIFALTLATGNKAFSKRQNETVAEVIKQKTSLLRQATATVAEALGVEVTEEPREHVEKAAARSKDLRMPRMVGWMRDALRGGEVVTA